MRKVIAPVSLCLLIATAPAWAVPEGAMPTTGSQASEDSAEQAKLAYNIGLTLVQKADASVASAEEASEESARTAAMERAQANYSEARDKFQETARLDPDMPGAWNMVGYTQRKLGNYDAALTAYERALALSPNYAQAIEYRAEAFLGLNRVEDAKQAYLNLFAGNRALSDQLLSAMKKWIEVKRKSPGEVSAATLKEFDSWVKERSKIATKTAALTREGAAASWQ